MTGFLSRMASRAAGQAVIAAPRIPSRYEPLPEQSGLSGALPLAPAPGAADVEPAATAPVVAPAAPPLPAPADTAAPPATSPPAPIAPGEAAAALRPSPPTPPPASIAPVVQRRAATPASRVAATPELAGEPSSASAPPVPPPATDRAVAAAGETVHADRADVQIAATRVAAPQVPSLPPAAVETLPAPRQAESQAKPPAPVSVRSTDHADHPAQADPVAPSATRASTPRPANPAPPTPASVIAFEGARASSALAPPGLAPDVPATAASPPVVEIHIGSIEIRAATAPAPAATAAPAAPTSTSLDAFLAQGRVR